MRPFIKMLWIVFMVTGSVSCTKNDLPPVLVITGNSVFGKYTREILKAEGFNHFRMDSLTGKGINLKTLKESDIVILSAGTLDKNQSKIFEAYVRQGGNLVAIRPDPQLSGIFGIISTGNLVHGGYIRITDSLDTGKGLTNADLQIHSTADLYEIGQAKQIASLLVDSIRDSDAPSVVCNKYGNGHGIAFLFDLPESIVYTRQGNPKLAGKEKDGINGLRAMDMFTDDWVSTSNNTINQADEQMRLLSHCIEKLSRHTKPLPRFWYFPDSLKCLVTLTNDGEYRDENHFEIQFRDIDSTGAKMTLYILDLRKVSKEWTHRWTAREHEIAGHPDNVREASNPTWQGMNRAIDIKKAEIAEKYGLPMRTNVNHWFVWCGTDSLGRQEFAAQAQLESQHGIGLDINYAHYDMNSNQGHFLGKPGTEQGNFTGSGLVMKFTDSRGRILNIYQHLNNVYDQLYNELRDPEGFFDCFKGLMDRSLHEEVYSFISIKAHNDEYYFSKEPLMKMLSYAGEKGIPVWSAVQLLDFMLMKDEASFSDISWSNHQLTFTLNSSLRHSHGLTFMIPVTSGEKKIKWISENGKVKPFTIRHVKGYGYAFVTVTPGQNYDFNVVYDH